MAIEIQKLISSIVWLHIGVQCTQKNKQFNLRKELAKKWFICKWWSIWSINICLQQGNGFANGGQ